MKLEDIEAMVQAATNGHNWAMAFEPDKHIVIGEDVQGGKCVVVIPNNGGYKQELQRDKARLIAAAPTIIKGLVETVEKMQAVVDAARAVVDDQILSSDCQTVTIREPLTYVLGSALAALDAKEQDDTATNNETATSGGRG